MKPESGENGKDGRLLRDIVYDRLKDDIRHGKLRPSEPLSENKLSKRLEISRTPIREALQRLAQEGLVRNVPGQGVTVAAPSMQEVFNVIHLRLLIEPELARLAAESIAAEDLEQLLRAVEEMEQAVEHENREAWSRADTLFHETLCEACPNELLGEMALQMRNRLHYMTTKTQTSQRRVGVCTHEHRAVVDAIAEEDAGTAQEAMAHHVEKLRESLFKQLTHGY